MLRAKDVMTPNVVSVEPDDSVHKAINLMLIHRISGLPVIDPSGELLGIISEFDLFDLLWDTDPGSREVSRYMSRQVHTVHENDELSHVAEQFRRLGVRRLPVTNGERVVGIVSRRDLLSHLVSFADPGVTAATFADGEPDLSETDPA
jgi:CBS domain-containing protein